MEIKIIYTQKVLSKTQINLADYVINPYRGCEFGCIYCYSQENKNLKDKNFSQFLGIKINAHRVLEKELNFIKPKRVLLGSVTECFLYQELKYKITQKILSLLNERNIPYTILTKSSLIKNYLSLIEKNKNNKIFFTLNFSSDCFIKLFEKNSPLLKERLSAIKEIIKRKINLRIHIGPFIPYLSSLEEIFKIIPSKVKEIDIEIYHHKMGNFPKLIEVIENNLGKNLSKKIKWVYQQEKNYYSFVEDLKKEIKKINKRFKIFFIVPSYNNFYNSSLNYEEPLF
jgi:DNA repair photolyase